ncbi:polymer-forming cytoskeletal protein [Paenibacillus tepidiphilus]|uniref:polymer-forming cytoskeletal protein n=1 Tax=Paenibacillus tepidiphilus TaxID=2608683 RepID=UPI00123B6FBE|nr:polymer-forming cytoskeletal protein [Paenibacillus tepidiphilus]
MNKWIKLMAIAGVSASILAGCGNGNNNGANEAASPSPAAEQTDANSSASIVNEADAFIHAVSAEGTWIVAITSDVTVDQDVVISGEFHDKGAAENAVYRKLALYAQDAEHNITDSYTLTAPKVTVQSENQLVQGGTIKGDVVVEANGFTLDKTATIDGNLTFASAEAQDSATLDGTVTGETAVQ